MNLFLALFWPPPATILVVIVMEVLAVLQLIDSDSRCCWWDHLRRLVGVPDRTRSLGRGYGIGHGLTRPADCLFDPV